MLLLLFVSTTLLERLLPVERVTPLKAFPADGATLCEFLVSRVRSKRKGYPALGVEPVAAESGHMLAPWVLALAFPLCADMNPSDQFRLNDFSHGCDLPQVLVALIDEPEQ